MTMKIETRISQYLEQTVRRLLTLAERRYSNQKRGWPADLREIVDCVDKMRADYKEKEELIDMMGRWAKQNPGNPYSNELMDIALGIGSIEDEVGEAIDAPEINQNIDICSKCDLGKFDEDGGECWHEHAKDRVTGKRLTCRRARGRKRRCSLLEHGVPGCYPKEDDA
jgi:hypothetical protein